MPDILCIKRKAKGHPRPGKGAKIMSMYYSTNELETITKACAAVPKFSNLMFMCAWKYSEYDTARRNENDYAEEHKSGRPTKERERLQVCCSRKFGEFWAMLESLHMIAEAYGTIHTGTIHDEILEIVDGYNTINSHKRMRELYAMGTTC